MGAPNSLNGLGGALEPGTYLLGPDQALLLEQASSAINQAIERADEYLGRARAVYVQHEKLGYRDGVERAEREAALRLVQETALLDQVLDGLTADLASIIMRSVQTLIGAMPPAEQAEGMARCALAQFRNQTGGQAGQQMGQQMGQQTGLRLRVPPQERAQGEELSYRLRHAVPGLDGLSVISDPEIPPHTFVVESVLGRVVCDARQIFDVFETAWKDAFSPGEEAS